MKNELDAMRAANSPLASKSLFHVVHPDQLLRIKVYMPMPNLGVDAYYLAKSAALAPDFGSPQPRAAALRALTKQLVERLVPLHQAGLMHNDIKPENIMVDDAGKVELIDFGLARAWPAPVADGYRGTPGYLPPENFGDLHASLDARLDTWSLGTSLLMLAAPHVFESLPAQQLEPEHGLGLHTPQGRRYRQQQLWAGNALERWYNDTFKPSGAAPARHAVQTREEARGYAALDAAHASMAAADPHFTELLFSEIYRAPVAHRADAEALRRKLDALPPLTQDAAADARLATQGLREAASLGRARYAEEVARPLDDANLDTLRALPVRPPSGGDDHDGGTQSSTPNAAAEVA